MRTRRSLLQWIAAGMILIASFLAILQLTRYSRVRANFPTGLKIAGIPVGGLNYELASDRLVKVYMSPIEMEYGENRIQVRPANLGFELRLQNMLAAADKQRTGESFWSGFWKYLWNRPVTSKDIPLQSHFDKNRLQAYLETEIASRYNEFAEPPMPAPGESYFYPGKQGTAINYSTTIDRIIQTLNSPDNRTVKLDVIQSSAAKPGVDLLDIMLKSIIDESLFDGWVELYMKDLQTGTVLHFTHSKTAEEDLPVDIAYSAWSTIKIPVLLTAFKYLQEPYDPVVLAQIEEMVEQSDNESTDFIGRTVIEQNLGPLRVSEDMDLMGLENTFWSGFFALGSPLLIEFTTPANQNKNYDTDPDRFAQTTPQDLGLLLEEIYYCAKDYGGAIPLAFDGEITQYECELMVEYLAKNRIAVFLQGGVPPEIQVAHKHGWAVEYKDGYMHTMGDAGIFYTPGGDYIISVFIFHPVQAIFDVVNPLVTGLSSAVYNYFNLE
jgi:beta-lactamase class A